MKTQFLQSLFAVISCSSSHVKAGRTAFLAVLLLLTGYSGFAAVTVTPAGGGTNICSNSAIGGSAPAFTTIGTITVAEGVVSDISNGFTQIILAPPAGWQFNAGATPSFGTSGGDVVAVFPGTFTSTSLTINIFATGTTLPDAFTISGLQVQATSTSASPGYIFASLASGILGITAGAAGTNFGNLALTGSVVPSVSISGSPSGSICAGTGVTFSASPVNGGASPTFNWLVNGGFAGSGVPFSSSTLANGNTVQVIMTPTAGGCFSPGSASSNIITMTVNPVPNAVTVSGGGTFCGSTTITAANGGSGIIYFQGTTSGGTSTATPATSQVINTSGTYYFRAQAAGGCWGTQGSVTVTINPAATANAGTPQSVCAGGTVTVTGSIGGSAASSTWSAPSGVFSSPGSLTSDYTPSIAGGPVTLTLTTNDPDGAGPCAAATSNVVITVNALPNPVVVSGGGTFCNSTTIAGANGGSGTIFFQGTTSGGTSTLLGGTPQTITTSGTYFFRARTGAGCWGTEGSATVTINAPATANAGTPQSVCAGGTITLAGTIGGSAVSSAWSAPSGTFSSIGSLTSTYTPSIASGNVTLTLTTNDPDGGGPCPAATSTVVITVNPLPNTPIVIGGGTFCGTTNINAFIIGPGTVFFQGTTSGGTSTSMGGSPQTVTASGTYFFRAQSAAGCWGAEGSVNVTINPLPNDYTVTGGGSYCFGGTGVTVGLSFSDAGINYRLLRGVTTVAILAGTNAALDFGLQTTAGTYTVVAINPATSCQRTMTGSAVVSVNPLPTAFTVTGTGSYCAGGTGVNVNLSGSTVGVNYELRLGGIPTGTVIAGTGSPFTFGPQTAAGVYTVVATNTLTSCVNNMLSSATVSINPLPNAFSVTGGGAYCSGGAGVSVGLGGSDVGINYQLFRDAAMVGAPLAGTGSALDFGAQTLAGTYTVVATNTTTLCTNTMAGSAMVSINSLPALFNVSGGGNFCSGGAGVNVGLTGSATGANYQLFIGASPSGVPMAGTGFALDFGAQTTGGTYTVVATDMTTLCTNNMTGSATVIVDPLPVAYTVTGGGSYCTGGAGVPVGLSSTDPGISYQLYNLFSPLGAPMAGTGGSISFGMQSTAGFYTIIATDITTGCTNSMTGGVAVTIIPLPTQYSVTGGGGYCAGDPGVSIGLSGSDIGTDYQLYLGITPVGTPVAGTGSALDFGIQSTLGTYTVNAINLTTGCNNIMSGSTTLFINPLPGIFNVSGGGIFCDGDAGVSVGLDNSAVGINYQLFNGVTAIGAPLAGTGAALDFGLQTLAGTYTVVAADAVTGCSSNMSGSATITVNPAPTAYVVIGGGGYCAGGSGVSVGLSNSDIGFDYQLFQDGTPVSLLAGTGAALDFGIHTTVGTYTVVAINTTTGCVATMTGSAVISVNPLPLVYTVTGGGAYCAGGAGVNISLSGSDAGINYQLFNGVTAVGTPIAGTGSPLDFGFHTGAGTYTIVATDATSGCFITMAGSAVIVVNPAPTAYTVTGGGTYCIGGAGFALGLSNSDIGADYQLFNGSAPVGGPMAGTGTSINFGFHTAAGTYTVEAVNTGTGCTGTMSGSATIIISLYPVVDPITGPSTLCQGASVTLSSITSGGAWSSGSTGIAIVDAFGMVTGVSSGTATISYTVTNGPGCATTVTANETVLPAPTVAPISGLTNVCAGLTVTLSDFTAGGVWSSSNTAVATVSSTGTVTGISFGSAVISYTVTSGSSGCATTVISPMSVGNPMPPAALLPVGSATICDGTPVNLSVVTSGSGLTYQWYVAGLPITGEVTSTYTATTPGFYNVSINNGTCSQLFTGTNVLAPPVPGISYDTLAGLLFTGSFVTYQWYLGGVLIPGATSNNVPIGPLGSVYTVVVSDMNGCHDTSAVFVVGGVSLNVTKVISGSEIKIYPNPATSIVHIDAPAKVFVSVLSADGRVLIERKEAISLNVSQLADGMYMMMIYDENNTLLKTEKFVKMQ